MNNTKGKVLTSSIISIIEIIIGVCLVILFAFGVSGAIDTNDMASGIISVVFIVIGILLIIFGMNRRKLIRDFKTYVTAISNESTGYIPNISAILGITDDVARKRLDLMIKKGYFKDALIDRTTDCIVISSRKQQSDRVSGKASQGSDTADKGNETVTVKCKSCGGINTVEKGKAGECEFCGSSIQA